MEMNGVQFDESRLDDFCRRHGVLRLALFGSALGNEFRPESDIDMLVDTSFAK